MTNSLALAYESHRERLNRLASFYTPQEAEDIVQDAFVCALQRYPQFRHDASLSTWLHRMVVNACISRYRRRRVRQRADLLRQALCDISARPISAETLAVRSAVQTLPRQEYLVLIMHDVIGYTHDEIAGTLRIPPGTSKWRLSAARRRLRNHRVLLRSD